MAKGQKGCASANDQNAIRREKKLAQKRGGKKKKFGGDGPSILQAIKQDKKDAKDRQRAWEATGREINTIINDWLDQADKGAVVFNITQCPDDKWDVLNQAESELKAWLATPAGKDRYFIEVDDCGFKLAKNKNYRGYRPRRRQAA